MGGGNQTRKLRREGRILPTRLGFRLWRYGFNSMESDASPPTAAGRSKAAIGLSLALVGIGLLHFTVGDLTWWGECVTVWPTVGWLALLSPRLAIWAHRRQWGDVALVGGLVVALVAGTTEGPGPVSAVSPPKGPSTAQSFRVVSWNVAGEIPLQSLALDEPDLVLMQEIGGMPLHSRRPPYFEDFTWLPDFDPGTLSRTPITRLPTRRVGPWQEPQVLSTYIHDRKVIVLNVRLMLPAFVVAVATLEPPQRLLKMHAERVEQFHRLRDLISETLNKERTASAILCGDFNSPGGIQSSEPLRAVMRDIWPEGGRGWGATMPAWLPMSRIDQCWVTPDIEVVTAVVRKGASDHRRLVADLRFR